MSSDLVNLSCFPANQNNLADKNRKHPLPLSHAHTEQYICKLEITPLSGRGKCEFGHYSELPVSLIFYTHAMFILSISSKWDLLQDTVRQTSPFRSRFNYSLARQWKDWISSRTAIELCLKPILGKWIYYTSGFFISPFLISVFKFSCGFICFKICPEI